jgi:hypothetical protein
VVFDNKFLRIVEFNISVSESEKKIKEVKKKVYKSLINSIYTTKKIDKKKYIRHGGDFALKL